MNEYQYTNNWFEALAKPVWDQLIPQLQPARVLEIGAYEGAATCYLIDGRPPGLPLELHCVDSWEGGIEHRETRVDMASVEGRFDHNTALALRGRDEITLVKHKQFSDLGMARLLADGFRNHFDFVYIDGSHQACDVLCDAVLGFRLLRVGGLMAFDDYLWSEELPQGRDLIRCPKPAIDAFVNLYFRKVGILSAPLYQLYVQKLAD